MSGRSLRSSNSPSRARSRSLQHVRKVTLHLSTYSGRRASEACLRSQVGLRMLLRELRARLVSFERLRQ